MLTLLAQSSATPEIAGWASIIASVTNVGFAISVAIYLLVIHGPKQLSAFEKAIAAERERADARELRREQESKEKITMMVTENRSALDKLISHSEKELDKVVQHCERESTRRDSTMGVIDKSLTNVGEVLEEVRDELREIKSGKVNPDDAPPVRKKEA